MGDPFAGNFYIIDQISKLTLPLLETILVIDQTAPNLNKENIWMASFNPPSRLTVTAWLRSVGDTGLISISSPPRYSKVERLELVSRIL